MRILVIVSQQPPIVSGVARTIQRLTDWFSDRGHHVDVVAGSDHRVWDIGEFRFSALTAQWPGLRRRLSEYDVVNIHGPAPTISDAFLCLLRTVPAHRRPAVVYTHHSSIELDGWRTACRAYERLHRRIAHLADRVIVTTPSYADLLRLPGRAAPAVVPWGVDAERFATEREPYDGSRPLQAVFLGQMRPYKGIPQIIEAASGQDAFELTLAGTGRHEHLYRRMAAASGCGARFVGRVPDDELADLFARHDVVLLPSLNRREAFGLTLLEGMAAGCVPVGSDLPGVRDVAGPTGRVVRPGDPADLRRTLLELAADPEGVAELQQMSEERARALSWDATFGSYEQIFVQAARRPAAIDSPSTTGSTRSDVGSSSPELDSGATYAASD